MKQSAIEIVRVLQNAGHQAVFAGGCVRDMLLRTKPKDYDIATDATPDQVESLFPKTVAVGKSFGVIVVIMNDFEFEVATFREDAKTGDGRRPDSVTFCSMEEDAKRRDLTINALFENPLTGQVYDFVNGKDDLLNQFGVIIRFVGNANDRIEEDALRMLRAIRFAVRFDAQIGQKDSLAIFDNAWRVDVLSGERVFDELTKILQLHKPRAWLPYMLTSGLLQRILPEVARLQSCDHGKSPWHLEGNVFEHTLRVLEGLPKDASNELLWGALLHDIGKPDTQAPSKTHIGGFSFHGHEAVGAKIALDILKTRFKCSSDFQFTVTALVREHMRMHTLQDMRLCTARRLLAEPFIEDLMKLSVADEMGCVFDPAAGVELAFPKWQQRVKEIRSEFIAKGTPLIPGCLVTGKDLIDAGFKPSPNFKIVLNRVQDEQLDGKLLDRETALKKAIQCMRNFDLED